MANKYLKMSDVFIGDVIAGDDDLIRDEDGLIGDMQWPSDCVKYAAHAINSHDELVEQREKMLKALKEAVDCGIVPSSSAKEGGAAKYARQVIVADMIREAIALVDGDKQ